MQSIPSPTHCFIPGLKKPSFSANPSHRSPSFFFFGIHYMDSPDCLLFFLRIFVFLLSSFSVLHFLVVGSVRQIELTRVGFRAHVKIASRIVSCRMTAARSCSSVSELVVARVQRSLKGEAASSRPSAGNVLQDIRRASKLALARQPSPLVYHF